MRRERKQRVRAGIEERVGERERERGGVGTERRERERESLNTLESRRYFLRV